MATDISLEKLTESMQHLCTIANRIVAAGGKVNRLERDLFMDDLRHLYDLALELPTDGQITYAPQKKEETPGDSHGDTSLETVPIIDIEVENHQDDNVQDKASEDMEQNLDADLASSVAASIAAIIPSQPTAEAEATEALPEPPTNKEAPFANSHHIQAAEVGEQVSLLDIIDDPLPEGTPQHKAEVPAEQASEVQTQPLADKEPTNHASTQTLADLLNKRTPASITNTANKISDLRTVINIGDKFSFMSELFKNNMRAYNEFIMTLNDMTERETALTFMAETASQWEWNEESPVVQNFRKIFDKKF